jgi:hypothetical protein
MPAEVLLATEERLNEKVLVFSGGVGVLCRITFEMPNMG